MEEFLIDEVQLINSWVVTFFGGYAEDIVDKTAVLLNAMPSAERLINALLHASLSPDYQKYKDSISWSVIHLPPILPEDENDIPPEAIANLDSLDIYHITEEMHWGLRTEGIQRFGEKAKDNPDLDAVIRVYADASKFKRLVVGMDVGMRIREIGLSDITDIKDPYYKARWLFHFYSLGVKGIRMSERVLHELLATIRSISDPLRQARAWELCFPLIPSQELLKMDAELKSNIERIEHEENKARAYGRMALLMPASRSADWFRMAISSAGAIISERRRAQTLQEMKRVIPNEDPEIVKAFGLAADSIADAWRRAKADDRLTDELSANPPDELVWLTEADAGLWAPILLSGTVASALKELQQGETIEKMWKRFAERPDEQLFDKIYRYGMKANRLTLTLGAAMAIEGMMNGNAIAEGYKRYVYELMPLFFSPALQAKTLIAGWKKNFDPFVAAHAHLLNVESGSALTVEDIVPLLYLVDSNSDMSRLRGYLAIASNIWNVEKERFITVSNIGVQVVEEVAKELLKAAPNEHYKRQALRAFFSNIIHDDTTALLDWAKGGSPVASVIFREIESVSAEAAATYANIFQQETSVEVKESLFVSNCKLAMLKQPFVSKVENFANWDKLSFREHYYPNTFAVLELCLMSLFEENELPLPEKIAAAKKFMAEKALQPYMCMAGEVNFANVGDIFYRWLGGEDSFAIDLALTVTGHDEDIKDAEKKIGLVYSWLMSEMASDKPNKEVEGCLIRLLAEIAKLMPNAIIVKNSEKPITELLVAKCDTYGSVWVRRGCIVLLGCLREIDLDILDLYLKQSREDKDIWAATIESINKISFVGPGVLDDLLAQLFVELDSESAIRAYFALRITVALGRNNNTNTVQKRKIVKRLLTAGKDILAQRNVYIFRGLGRDKEDVVAIDSLISLEKAFDHAIIEIIGLS